MAKKRMFSLDVVNTDRFLDMSISARLLYFDLGMRADDEGFVGSPNMIIRSTGNTHESMSELIEQGYVIPFQSGVIVIPHWKMNNYLQNDRIAPTIYTDEKGQLSIGENKIYSKEENSMDTECIQNVSNMYTQYSIDKNSIDKNIYCRESRQNRKKKGSKHKNLFEKLPQDQQEELTRIINHLNESIGSNYRPNTKDTVIKFKNLKELDYKEEDFFKVIDNKVKDWANSEQSKYLRPETLFRESHFESYLNERGHFKKENQKINLYADFESIK